MATQSIHWRRLVAEGLAIVLSILLAFALDAAWDAASDRRSERELLSVLQTELREARESLDVIMDIYVHVEKNTKTVADMLAAAGSGTVMVADTLLASVMWDMSYDPPTGTATTLLASGQVGLLQSLELRSALAGWPAAIEDGVEEQLSSWRLGDERLEPLLQASVPNLGPAYSVMSLWSKQLRDGEPFNSFVNGVSDGETGVTTSPELWNVVYQQLTMISMARVDLTEVTQAQLQRLEALVAQELVN